MKEECECKNIDEACGGEQHGICFYCLRKDYIEKQTGGKNK